jgi:hypothetical protein
MLLVELIDYVNSLITSQAQRHLISTERIELLSQQSRRSQFEAITHKRLVIRKHKALAKRNSRDTWKRSLVSDRVEEEDLILTCELISCLRQHSDSI